MKKFTIILFAAFITLSLTSCSSEADMFTQEEVTAKSLLESYTLTRDARGSYSLVSTVAEGVVSEIYKNEATNTNEVHLFQGNSTTARQVNNTLALVNSELNIEFFDATNTKRPILEIIEGDISKVARGEDEIYFLNSYSVVSNEDGTYQFNFEVKDNVNVSYGYNEEDGVNEIYLTDNGDSEATNFSKTYSLDEDGKLKVDFVHSSSSSSKDASDHRRRPRVVVGS